MLLLLFTNVILPTLHTVVIFLYVLVRKHSLLTVLKYSTQSICLESFYLFKLAAEVSNHNKQVSTDW